MKTKIKPIELFSLLAKYYAMNEPLGQIVPNEKRFKPYLGWTIESEWQVTWGIDCRLYVDPSSDTVPVKITGASISYYTPSGAIARAALIHRVAVFACGIEQWLAQWDTSHWEENPSGNEWEAEPLKPVRIGGNHLVNVVFASKGSRKK